MTGYTISMFNSETSTHFQWKIPFGTRQLIPASPHFSKDFAKNLAIGWNSLDPVVAARIHQILRTMQFSCVVLRSVAHSNTMKVLLEMEYHLGAKGS